MPQRPIFWPLPHCGRGRGPRRRRGRVRASCWESAIKMRSATPSVFVSTSLFQNRNTRHPRLSSHAVRRKSSGSPACCEPSASIASRYLVHPKSSTKGPTGSWRRNLYPSNLRSRRMAHNRRSVSVDLRRNPLAVAVKRRGGPALRVGWPSPAAGPCPAAPSPAVRERGGSPERPVSTISAPSVRPGAPPAPPAESRRRRPATRTARKRSR